MKNCVYIINCDQSKYYVGSTVDLEERLKKHIEGKVYSSKKLGVRSLAFAQEFKTLKEARQIEFWIKRQKSKKLIEKIIQDKVIRKTLCHRSSAG